MYCENEKGKLVDLSSTEYRSCAGGKCGGWKWVKAGCAPWNTACQRSPGAWLPAAEVCRLNLYAKFEKRTKTSVSSSSSSSGSSSSSSRVSSSSSSSRVSSSSSSFSSSSSIPAPSRAIRAADYVCPNSCPTGCCDEEGWVCCPDGLYCAATIGDCPASGLGMLAVTSKPLFDPTVCEGTECPAGCCPGENWFCCPDNIYCASEAKYCPSAAADITGEPTTIVGVEFDPAAYFDTDLPPMRFVSGATAGEFVIPEWLGFNRAVYINAQGGITDEYVAPRQIVRFRSTIVLGYDPEGSQAPGLPAPPEFTVSENIGNVEVGPVYKVSVTPVAGATGYVFRFNGSAIRPDYIGPQVAASALPEGLPAIGENEYLYTTELDGYAMTVASVNSNGTGLFSGPIQIGLTPCDPVIIVNFGAEYTSCPPGQDCCFDGKCRSLCDCSHNEPCPAGLCCKEGNCVECCEPPCNDGFCCVNGECKACECTPACGSCKYCKQGIFGAECDDLCDLAAGETCCEGSGGKDASCCGAGFCCNNGNCEKCCHPPCDEKACEYCKDGECYDWCTSKGGVCNNGECSSSTTSCYKDSDCPGECCADGKCQNCKECQEDSDCGFVCDLHYRITEVDENGNSVEDCAEGYEQLGVPGDITCNKLYNVEECGSCPTEVPSGKAADWGSSCFPSSCCEGKCEDYCTSSVSSDPLTINGTQVDPKNYFETSLPPINAYTGSTGNEFTVPEWLGYNNAVYVDSSGQVTEEYVAPGDVLTFKSTIILGYDPAGSQAPGLPAPPEFTVESVGNQEVGPVYKVSVTPVAGATGYVFRFNGVAIRPTYIGPQVAASALPEGLPAIGENEYLYNEDLDGYSMTVASTNGQGTGPFSEPTVVGDEDPCELCLVWTGETIDDPNGKFVCPCDSEFETCCNGKCIDSELFKCCGEGLDSYECPKDNTCCGKTCCDVQEFCCGDQTCCSSAAPAEICINGKCCPDYRACGGICCPENTRCVDGTCCPDSQACGEACCKENEACIVPFGGEPTCCPAERQCAGGSECCADGEKCVNDECCPNDRATSNINCCPEGEKACGTVGLDAVCCPENRVCCEGVCCPDGETCVNGLCSPPCDPPCEGCSECINGKCESKCYPDQCCNDGVCGDCATKWAFGIVTCPDGSEIFRCRPDELGPANSIEECQDLQGPGHQDEKCPCVNGETCEDGSCCEFPGMCTSGGESSPSICCPGGRECWREEDGDIITFCCPEGTVCENGECVEKGSSSSS